MSVIPFPVNRRREQLSKKRILVIDDDAMIRELVVQTLQPQGYDCVQKDNAIGVNELIRHQNIDMVILDIVMNDKEGIETLTELKEEFAQLPVLMISSDAVYLGLASSLGADDVIHKPLPISELRDKVARILK